MKSFLFSLLLYICNYVIAKIPSHIVRKSFYRVFMNLEIGFGSFIFMCFWLDTRGNLKIGNNSIINQKCRLDNRGNITIGNNVSISSEVCILTADHDLKTFDFDSRISSVNIEDYVFVGTRAMILPGVTLGEGSAVAAGAVVTKDVFPFTIVAGVPAKSIGNRPKNLNYSCHYPRLFF